MLLKHVSFFSGNLLGYDGYPGLVSDSGNQTSEDISESNSTNFIVNGLEAEPGQFPAVVKNTLWISNKFPVSPKINCTHERQANKKIDLIFDNFYLKFILV